MPGPSTRKGGPQADEVRFRNYMRLVRGGMRPPGGVRGGWVITGFDHHGGDRVSRREIPGPQDHFRRLDRGHDGCLDAGEAPPSKR